MESTVTPKADVPNHDCVICLSTITEQAFAIPCNHSLFDFICLISWLQQNPTCPLCKTKVTSVQYNHHSESNFKTFHLPPSNTTSPTTSTLSSRSHTPFPPRRTPRRHHRAPTPPNRDIALLRRRFIYKERLYSLYIGSNQLSSYRNLTPETISSSPSLQSRARMFIRRELRVFTFLYNESSNTTTTTPSASTTTTSSKAEWLLTYTLSILKNIDIKASDGRAENLLTEFLGRPSARLFLHELNAWLRSPFAKLDEWDRHVQYRMHLPDEFNEDGRPVWWGERMRQRERSSSPAASYYERRRRRVGGRDRPD